MKNTSTAQPALRFPEFQGDGEWKEEPLRGHLTESRVRGSSGDLAKKLTVKLWGNGVYEKEETTSGSVNTQYYRRKRGQFIYSKLDFLNQAFGIIPDSLDGFESTVDLPCFDVGQNLCPHFLLEYVQRKEFYKRFGEIADGGRKAKRIQVETFYGFPIALPPSPAEQQKIADCLGSLDDLIAAHSRKLAALQDHKKGLLQQLFPAEGETTPKLRFPEFEGEWDVEPTANLYSFIPTNSFSRDKMNQTPGKVRNIHYGDIHKSLPSLLDLEVISLPQINASVSLQKFKERSFCKDGDLIFADASEDVDDIGKSIEIVHTHGHKVLSGLHTIHARQKTPRLVVGFAGHLFQSKQIRAQIRRESQGAKVLGISASRLSIIKVCFPKEKREQQKIADCLSDLDALITAQTEQIAALKAHKKGLMQQLFPNPEFTKA